MTTTTVHKDPAALTMRVTTQIDAPIERVWQLWEDPRQLERWWGPPSYPATVVEHDLTPGGRVTYYMTGPEGEQYHGWWRIVSVSAPHVLEFEDGFADDDGTPNDELPTTTSRIEIRSVGDGSEMAIVTTFGSLESMEQLIEMGAEEGMVLALGQIDAVLAG